MGGTKRIHRRGTGLVLVLGAILTSVACGDDFLLSAGNLDIGPDPAQPGDQVVATFFVEMIPVQPHTYIFMIDGEEHLRVDGEEPPDFPVTIDLGDASDLIEAHGVGEHTAQVRVRLDDSGRSARTETTTFELQDGGS